MVTTPTGDDGDRPAVRTTGIVDEELKAALRQEQEAAEETPSLAVVFYMAGGIGAVVVSTIIIWMIAAVPAVLYLAPLGNAALTVFLVTLFTREYREAVRERRLDTLDAHALRKLKDAL